jgi:hypothetical protein
VSVFDKLVSQPATAPEREFIRAVRLALREYDRKTGNDRRRLNGHGGGSNKTDPKKITKGLDLLDAGRSIRAAAAAAGLTYGALWLAKERKKNYNASVNLQQKTSVGKTQRKRVTP